MSENTRLNNQIDENNFIAMAFEYDYTIIDSMKEEIADLKQEVADLKDLVNQLLEAQLHG